MNNKIIEALKKPAVYTPSGTAFWDDDYISGQMLKAHLDPDFEGASRKLSFIEKSAAWLSGLVPPSDYPQLLDIGCGPGIYAEKFARAGYQVTGVDFPDVPSTMPDSPPGARAWIFLISIRIIWRWSCRSHSILPL